MTDKEDLFHVRGGTAASGTRYVNISSGSIYLWVKASDFASTRGGLDQALSDRQIIFTNAQRSRLIQQASEITVYPPVDLAEKGGWVGDNHHISRGGQNVSAEGARASAEVVFVPETSGSGHEGTVRGWKRNVAQPLTGQTLLQFLIMLSFAGPILSLTNRLLNILFEVIGLGGEGKSTAVQIAASACGPVIDQGSGTYWFTPSGTTGWLEQQMLAHADATAFINEFQVFGAGETGRAKMVYDFVFRFTEGQTRGRLVGLPPLTYRGVGVLTGNQPVRELTTDRYAHLINPTTSRLISLPGDAGHGLGTLDFVPKGFSDGRPFVSSILEATRDQHGTALPTFIAGIVSMRSKDAGALRRQITEHVEDFLGRTDGDAGGMRARIAEAFAIGYVAGRLARHLGVLPEDWDPLAIALECYRRYVASIQAVEARSVRDLLRDYAARAGIIDLARGLPELTDEELKTVPGFVETRDGSRELMVTRHAITRLFADWQHRKDTPEVATFLLRGDGAHVGRKRVVRSGRKVRVYVFKNFD